MARYKRLETLQTMKEVGVIPVFYNGDFEVAKSVVCACADGGAKVVEERAGVAGLENYYHLTAGGGVRGLQAVKHGIERVRPKDALVLRDARAVGQLDGVLAAVVDQVNYQRHVGTNALIHGP